MSSENYIITHAYVCHGKHHTFMVFFVILDHFSGHYSWTLYGKENIFFCVLYSRKKVKPVWNK